MTVIVFVEIESLPLERNPQKAVGSDKFAIESFGSREQFNHTYVQWLVHSGRRNRKE
jgi:hypothetical protein